MSSCYFKGFPPFCTKKIKGMYLQSKSMCPFLENFSFYTKLALQKKESFQCLCIIQRGENQLISRLFVCFALKRIWVSNCCISDPPFCTPNVGSLKELYHLSQNVPFRNGFEMCCREIFLDTYLKFFRSYVFELGRKSVIFASAAAGFQ